MVSRDVSTVFRAISDPTRREILDLLRDRNLSVREISEHFPVSRPAISKHLRILKESGLARERRQGRERLYTADLKPLEGVRAWLGAEVPAGSARASVRTGADSKTSGARQTGRTRKSSERRQAKPVKSGGGSSADKSETAPTGHSRGDWQIW